MSGVLLKSCKSEEHVEHEINLGWYVFVSTNRAVAAIRLKNGDFGMFVVEQFKEGGRDYVATVWLIVGLFDTGSSPIVDEN